jgi:tRNA(Ile)-lysidine synthase
MEIVAYNKQKKLVYRVDKSNKDTKFIRNKIRHGLLPYLEDNFNPAIKKTLSEWSVSVADDYDFISQSAERLARGICKNKCRSFSAKAFFALPISIQREFLRNVFKTFKKGLVDIENKQIAELLKVIKSGKNKNQKAIIGGLNISKKGDKVDMF